ncbi:MAG: hypothetical protein LLG45_13200 [Actinomycetia bacterium]|nr:hypothetical protein [Actinomycetes bacterium]
MASPVTIPCMCDNGRPCGKVTRVSMVGRMYHLDIVGHDDSKGMLIDERGRKALIEALGGRP